MQQNATAGTAPSIPDPSGGANSAPLHNLAGFKGTTLQREEGENKEDRRGGEGEGRTETGREGKEVRTRPRIN